MIIFPAIDLFDGKVVRLSQGDFSKKTAYETSPVETARRFIDAGCDHIHVVDLEGAKTGRPCHLDILESIAGLGIFVQYGGGLRSELSIREAFSSGADRVMAGSILFKDIDMPHVINLEFGAAVMPCIDIAGGIVSHLGWLESTGLTPLAAVKNLYEAGFTSFLVTDTERDGLMGGARKDIYVPLIGEGYEIIAAGGITTARDITALASAGVSGAVIGKSLYEGGITLGDALKAAERGRLV